MSENRISILIKAILDTANSQEEIKEAIQELEKQAPKIKFGTDIDEKDLAKFTRKYSQLTDKAGQVTQEVYRYNKGLSESLKIINHFSKEKEEVYKTDLILTTNREKQNQLEKQKADYIAIQTKNLQTQAAILKNQNVLGDFTKLDDFLSQLNSRTQQFSIENYKVGINELANEYKLYAQAVRESHNANVVALKEEDKRIQKYNQVSNALGKLKERAESINKVIKNFGNKEHHTRADDLVDSLNKLNVAQNMTQKELEQTEVKAKRLFSSLQNVSKEAKATGNNSMTLSKMLSTAAEKFTVWISVTAIFFGTVRAIKRGIESIQELDDALVELRKVTELSKEELKSFTEQASIVGERVARTTAEVTKATAMFARMGFTVQESLYLAEWANILTNVGDGIDTVEEASKSIISTLKGFGMEASEVEKIIDSLNEVSNNFAVETSDLSEGIRRVSATLSSAGNTFDETMGLLTAAIEVIQDAPRAATGIRTIALRLRGVTEEGEEIEGLIPKLEKNFRKFGLTLEKSNGQFKSTYEILKDLASVRNQMTDFEFAEISELVSGKRQSDILNAILTNIESATAAMETSIKSTGSAIREQEAYLDSITAKINQFKRTTQDMWQNTISSETIKFFVDLGTLLIKLVDNVGLVTVAITGLMTIISLKLPTAFTALYTKMGLIAVSAEGMATAFNGVTLGATTMNTVLTLGIGAAVMAVVAGIHALKNAHDNYIKTINKNIEAIEKSIQQSEKEIDSLNQLAEEYNKLLSKSEKTIEEKKRLSELNDTLIKNYPELNTAIDSEGKLLHITAEALQNVNEARRESIRLQRQELLEQHEKKIDAGLAHLYRTKFLEQVFRPNEPDIHGREYVWVRKVEESFEDLVNTVKIYRDEILSIEKDLGEVSDFSNTLLLKVGDAFVDQFIVPLQTGEATLESFKSEWINLIRVLNSSEINVALEQYKEAFNVNDINAIQNSYVQLDVIVRQSTKGLVGLVDIFGTLDDVLKGIESKTQRYALTHEELIKSYEDLNKALDNSKALLSGLASAYDTLNKGEKLSVDNLIDLLRNHSQLATYLEKTNDLTFKRGEIIKQVWEIERNTELKRLAAEREKLQEEYRLQESLYRRFNQVEFAAGILSPEMETIQEELRYIKALEKIYKDFKIETFSKTSNTSLSPIPYEDLTKELIKAYNAEVERNKIAAKLIEKQIKLAERTKDYNKAIESTNKLLDNQRKTITDLEEANRKIHEEANRLRANSKYDTTLWFDERGEATLAYKELLNSFAGKTDEFSKKEKEAIESLFKKLYDLKQAWYNNADAIDTFTESIYQSQQKIEDYKKAIEDLEEQELEQLRKQQDELQKQANAKLKLYEDTEKEIINLLKKRYKQESEERKRSYDEEIEKLENEKKAYRDYIQSRIEELDRMYDKEDYKKSVKEQSKAIADIQKEIDKYTLAARTGDMEAIAKIMELEKKKAEEEMKLDEMQTKRERDLRKQNLQDNLKEFEDYIDKKKREEEKAYEHFKSLMDKATEDSALALEAQRILMTGSLVEVEGALIELFTVTNENATKTGQILQNQIISRLEQIRDINNNLEKITEQSSGNNPLGMSQADFRKYVDNKREAERIGDPTNARFKQLHEENERLRRKYGIKGDFYSWTQLVGYYRDGGINTQPGLAMLHGTPQNPEWILNNEQMKRLITNLAFNVPVPKINIPNSVSSDRQMIQIQNLVNVEGDVIEDTIPLIQSGISKAIGELKGLGVRINSVW